MKYLIFLFLLHFIGQTYSNPSQFLPLSPTSVEFYYQAGDFTLLNGTYLQLEANFNSPPFFSPCPSQPPPSPPSSFSFPPPPLLLPCPCAPCTPTIPQPSASSPFPFPSTTSTSSSSSSSSTSTSPSACTCEPDPYVACLAPNTFNFSASLPLGAAESFRVLVPLPQHRPLRSLAVLLHFIQGDGGFFLHFAGNPGRNASSDEVGDDWLILCEDALAGAPPLLIIDVLPVTHFSLSLIRFELSVLLDQPLLPLYLFAPVAPLLPSLLCVDNPAMPSPTAVPLALLPSVDDAAMYLSGMKTATMFGRNFGGYNLTVALAQHLIPTRLNLNFIYSARGRDPSRPWPYYNVELHSWAPMPVTPQIDEFLPEISLEGCSIVFENPLYGFYDPEAIQFTNTSTLTTKTTTISSSSSSLSSSTLPSTTTTTSISQAKSNLNIQSDLFSTSDSHRASDSASSSFSPFDSFSPMHKHMRSDNASEFNNVTHTLFAPNLSSLSNLTLPIHSRMQDCRFEELRLELHDSSTQNCTNYACYFVSILTQLLSLESYPSRPPIHELSYWTREKIYYRRTQALMLISSKPYHTCRMSFWNDLVLESSQTASFSDDVCHIWDHQSPEWQADPCCNPALDALCVSRNTTLPQPEWNTNNTALKLQCPSSCVSSFLNPGLNAFPTPAQCNLAPMLLVAFESVPSLVINDVHSVCLSMTLQQPCASDADCLISAQFCHPFARVCVQPCQGDADCRAFNPQGFDLQRCNVAAGYCATNLDTVDAEVVHQLLSACLFDTLSFNEKTLLLPRLDMYFQLDKYKLLSLLMPEDLQEQPTPELALEYADRAIFPSGCFGPGAAIESSSDCLQYPLCNWQPGVICTSSLVECQQACELPPSRPSPSLCETCHMGPHGLVCREVSQWPGCVNSDLTFWDCTSFYSIGAIWDEFAQVCFVAASSALECPSQFQWQDAYLTSEAECLAPAQSHCSDRACVDPDCTAASCQSQYGRCGFVDPAPFSASLNMDVSTMTPPHMCIVRPLLFAQTGRACPELSIPSALGCMQPLSDMETCLANQGVWLDLTDQETCTSTFYCPDQGMMGFFITDEVCRAAGREPLQPFLWHPARWVSADGTYRWTPRQFSSQLNQWSARLDDAAYKQLRMTADVFPMTRALQLQISCYYARHFAMYSLAGCTCFSNNVSNTSIEWEQKLKRSSDCFEIDQFPILMETVPICSRVEMDNNWVFPPSMDLRLKEEIGFIIDNESAPVFSPNINRLCSDVGFIGRMVASEATLIDQINVDSYGRAIAYELGSSDPLYRVYNFKNVRVGVLSGNGLVTVSDIPLEFSQPLLLCLGKQPNQTSDAKFSYLSGCTTDKNNPHKFIITHHSHTHEFPDTICFPVDHDDSYFPCSILPNSQEESYFTTLPATAQAALLVCVICYGLAFIGSLGLFAYLFPLKNPHLSVFISVVLIASLFLLLRLLFFIVIMNGKLVTGEVLEVFLSMAPTVIFFSLLSVLLLKWLTLGFMTPKSRSKVALTRLPPLFLVPILLVNILLYLLLLIVIIATGVIGDQTEPVCSSHPSNQYNWLYYLVFSFRILMAVFAMIMIVGCTLAAIKIFRILKNALPSRVAIRRLWLFFGLIACALFSLVSQTVLLLLFFITPKSITLALAVTTSLLIELLPVTTLLILLFFARQTKNPFERRKRTLFDICYGNEDLQPYREGNEVNLLGDNDLSDDRELIDHPSVSYTTQDDWSVK